MQEPITAHFRWTEDEFLRALQAHQRPDERRLVRRFIRWGLRLIAALMLLTLPVIFYEFFFGDELPFKVFLPLVTFILAICYIAFFHKIVYKIVQIRQFRKTVPEGARDVEMIITQDSWTVRVPISETTNRWELIRKIVEDRDGFLLYHNDQFFNWLPTHAFDTEDGAERFAELALKQARSKV